LAGNFLSAMSDSTAIVRALILYGIVLPLAILLGYLMVKLPDWDFPSLIVVGLICSIVCLPLFLKWHHQLLFLIWNCPAVIFFLPGRPELWMFLALASFTIVIIQRALGSDLQRNPAPSVLWPLLFLLVVVISTACATGGIHLGSLGGHSLGGRHYLYMIAAVLGFIAMTSFRIPENKAHFYIGAYFLGALPNLFGDLVQVAGSWLSFILVVFPVDVGTSFLDEDTFGLQDVVVNRDPGLTAACAGVLFYMLARYGLKNLLQGGIFKKLFFLIFFAGSMLGGFRSFLILFLFACFFMFWFEGLFRSKFVIIPITAVVVLLAMTPFANKLPASIQRTVSFLPVNVAPDVRANAEVSSEWRLDMWRILLPQIPHYFWLGKGFESDTKEFVSTLNFQQRGMGGASESAMMSGDYHNGPLSVIIPFGIWGAIGWLWFLAAALRALYLNHRHSPVALQSANTFLLALFAARIVLFFFVYGAFQTDLAVFAGLVALSISLNGGVRRAVPGPVQKPKAVSRSIKFTGRLAPGLGR
jgi:O-Antigen ligase